jgi:flavin reductase (DIM6/NTAB) family NADH-FMN oxidoreductase RutF
MGEDRRDLLDRFSRSDMRDQRFASGEWSDAVGGVPALKDALSTHFCSVVEHHDFGSHTVFFGAVEDVILSCAESTTSPILWLNGAHASVAASITD